jgi:inhibitor of cysteine peptidase
MVKIVKAEKWIIFSFLVAILVVSAIPLSLYLMSSGKTGQPEEENALNKFSSYEELQTFLKTSPDQNLYSLSRSDVQESDNTFGAPKEPSAAPEAADSLTGGNDYSKTNIQVEGVDEADIVKTDGEYIYIVSGNNVTIVKAYPAEEAKVVSKITVNGTIMGMFVNGDKLAVFVNEYSIYILYGGVTVLEDSVGVEPPEVDSSTMDEGLAVDEEGVEEPVNVTRPQEPTNSNESVDDSGVDEPKIVGPIKYEPPTTSIQVYDISDKENPVLTRDFTIDGNYFDSRMIGDYVYVVATMYTVFTETEVALPRIQSENSTDVIPATDIYYSNYSDTSYTFTTIIALNIQHDAQEPKHETIVLGGTSAIYVSQNNIYLTFPDYSWREDETMKTIIQRVKIDQQTITFEATGEVPGYLLNQFSMDESNDHFRIATTVYSYNWRTFDVSDTSKNNVYILNMNLNIVGKLEDLAPGEQIYSTRFIGNRLYMVTFRNIDPLFVIDLSDPTSPTVLGQLKVTGYSGYLHPYDETHIIGIGKETEYEAKDNFSWYQGVKISLFDVSDVSNPVEVAKYEIGDRGTDSPVLYDHKALLFDKEKNLLVIPVWVAEIDETKYEEGVPDWAYGDFVWQGAYVFNISLEGVTLRGQITHMEDGTANYGYYYYYTNPIVQRSLYIEDVLYTISNMKVKMNNLQTLSEINEVNIS